jgi:hypothetical protein
MPITRTNMIDDDGSGTTGTIINNAWKQEFYNQIDVLAGGAWTQRAFNAANYYPEPPLTWTPTPAQITFDRYTYLGNTLLWHLKMSGITLGGTASGSVRIKPPAARAFALDTELLIVNGASNGAYALHRLYLPASGDCWIRRLDFSVITPANFVAEFFAMTGVV